MKPFRWDPHKNERLKTGRGISFEEIVAALEEDGLKDILVHPNQRRYPGQVVLAVAYRDYIFLENALGFLAFAKNIQFQRNVAQFHKG